MATGTIRFHFDSTLEIVTAEPHWTLATEDDCRAWFEAYERYFQKLGRGKVDVVFVLTHFRVEPGIARVWGVYRAKLVRTYTRHTMRVDANVRLSTTTHVSGVLHGVSSEEAPTVTEAIRAIVARRAG